MAQVIRIYTVAFLLSLLLIPSASASVYAWWVTIKFIPDDKKILSIPIGKIDERWKRVKVLTKDEIPKEALESDPHDPMREYGYVFSHVGDFNNDSVQDMALVGVYEDLAGKFGRFILILTHSPSGSWQKAFLSKLPGCPGFSILWPKGSTVVWSLCMECGSYGELIWDGKSYRIEWATEDYG